MPQAAKNSYATAIYLTFWLFKELNYKFRDAHRITGKIVNFVNINQIFLSEISLSELRKFEKRITNDVFNILSPINNMKKYL